MPTDGTSRSIEHLQPEAGISLLGDFALGSTTYSRLLMLGTLDDLLPVAPMTRQTRSTGRSASREHSLKAAAVALAMLLAAWAPTGLAQAGTAQSDTSSLFGAGGGVGALVPRNDQASDFGLGVALGVWRALTPELFAELRNAAELGEPEAQARLGQAYWSGDQVERSQKTAIDWLEKSADGGSWWGYSLLGAALVAAEPAERDVSRGLAILLNAYDAGDGFAAGMIAWAKLAGLEGEPDFDAFFAWSARAEALEDPEGTAQLGLAYLRALGVAQDSGVAIRLLRSSVERGSGLGNLLLGHLHRAGEILPADRETEIAYFAKAGELGWLEGWAMQGAHLLDQADNPAAQARGLALAQKAAEGDDPVGLLVLANAYRLGRGVAADPAMVASLIRKLAALQHPEALNEMGVLYEQGYGVERDFETAARWYRHAMELGSLDATHNLGLAYTEGRGVARDPVEAVRLFRLAAEAGHSGAQNSLGLQYELGEGVAADPAEAVRWYRLSAENGERAAMNNLGMRYHEGVGVPQDYAEAQRILLEAAELGSHAAHNNLGLMYFNGYGVALDHAEAKRWFERAIELGSFNALNNLGLVYGADQGVPVDYGKALALFQRSYEQGNTDGLMNIASAYLNGHGVEADPKKAAALFREVSLSGKPAAMRTLGHLYLDGRGVEKDLQEAHRLLLAAAAGEDPQAMVLLGGMAELGEAGAVDLQAAAEWFRRAAELDDPDGLYNLGRFAEHGIGRAPSLEEAARWYRLAVAQDHPLALTGLGLMKLEGRLAGDDGSEGLALIRRAAQSGLTEAQGLLASLYLDGKLVTRDREQVRVWLEQAAQAGDLDAQFHFGVIHQESQPPNMTEALRWFRAAAEKLHPPALNAIGAVFGNGHGVAVDHAKAARYYKAAAALGESTAQLNLGLVYMQGSGLQRDLVRSLIWLEIFLRNQEHVLREEGLRLHEVAIEALSPEHVARAQEIARSWAPMTPEQYRAKIQKTKETRAGKG